MLHTRLYNPRLIVDWDGVIKNTLLLYNIVNLIITQFGVTRTGQDTDCLLYTWCFIQCKLACHRSFLNGREKILELPWVAWGKGSPIIEVKLIIGIILNNWQTWIILVRYTFYIIKILIDFFNLNTSTNKIYHIKLIRNPKMKKARKYKLFSRSDLRNKYIRDLFPLL